MTEKKKLAVVLDAGSTSAPNAQSSFDFTGFQESLDSTSSTAAHNTTRAGGENGGDSYTTSYQTRKTSIADGLTTEQLVVEHRKSIANATGADAAAMGGVTLSRRQSMTHEEYGAEVTEKSYSSLEPYQFKDHDDAPTE